MTEEIQQEAPRPKEGEDKAPNTPKWRGNEPLLDVTTKKKRLPTTHDVIVDGKIIGTSPDADKRAEILKKASDQ